MAEFLSPNFKWEPLTGVSPAEKGFTAKTPIFIAESPSTKELVENLKVYGPLQANILLTSETGAGKDEYAKALHAHSARVNGPFIEINCAALPGELIEAECFGWKKGAFTGAHQNRVGRVACAHKGTLFANEINKSPITFQGKFLRVLERKVITPLGTNEEIEVDFRLIAASSENLEENIKQGTFLKDLYYRIAVIPIFIPPLRDRPEDIAALAHHFLKELASSSGHPRPELELYALSALLGHDWPGNVRQLKNLLYHAWVLANGRPITGAVINKHLGKSLPLATSLKESWNRHKALLVKKALELYPDQPTAAKALGISPSHLKGLKSKFNL